MPNGIVKRNRYAATLESTKRRTVQCSCSPTEKQSMRDAYPRHGQVSELIRECLERVCDVEFAEPEPAEKREWLSAQLAPEEIDLLAAAARASGLEPTIMLRLLATARARVGTGDVLYRLLASARE